VVPDLIELVPEAKDLFLTTLSATWKTIEQLLDAGINEEMALYLLPNAFPVRFQESGELLHLHHKWRKRAGLTPFCPEGPRFCGVPVWNLDLPQFQRLI
jgi:hypothetical protein